MTWAIFGLVMLLHRTRFMEAFRFYEQYSELHRLGRKDALDHLLRPSGRARGSSLGKWMAGLRVSRTDRGGPPGLARGSIRTLVFYGLLELPADLVGALRRAGRGAADVSSSSGPTAGSSRASGHSP